MENRSVILPTRSGWRRWVIATCTVYFLWLGGALADSNTLPPKPQDLTGMSLEDLLHEAITPVNVLGSHTHLKQEFMVGYRYMFMDMEDNLEGTRVVSPSEVLQRYPVVANDPKDAEVLARGFRVFQEFAAKFNEFLANPPSPRKAKRDPFEP